MVLPGSIDVGKFSEQCAAVGRRIAELAAVFDGSISAEHGIGLLKRDYLHYTRSPTEIELMEVKRVFDPKGVMNPGKIF